MYKIIRRLQGVGLLGGGDKGGHRHVVVDHRRLNLGKYVLKKFEIYILENQRIMVAHRGLPALAGRCHHCVTLDASCSWPLSCTLGGDTLKLETVKLE